MVGKFVEINIEYTAGGFPAVVSREIAYDEHAWTVHCYPRGAPGDPNAGEYLSVHLVNGTNARNGKVHFEVMVLCRCADGGLAPPCANYHVSGVFEYPAKGTGAGAMPWARIVRTADLEAHCVVGGHATVVCGLTVLRHGAVPVPPSTYAADMGSLEVARRKFGDPDVTFDVDGRRFGATRRVLAARSPVFRAELEGPMAESTMAVISPKHEFGAATFCALLLYIYCDRLPRGGECGCPRPLTTELVRDLLAVADWYALDRLKLMCARRLWHNLSVRNVSKTLWYADRYNCPQPKNVCLDFLAVGDNFKHAFSTEEFNWLLHNSPSILGELRARFEAREQQLE